MPLEPTPRSASVARARWSLMAMFALFGVVGPSWLSRLPSIRAELGLTSGALGALLIVGAAGALASTVLTGAVVTRFGTRTTAVAATVGTTIGLTVIAWGVTVGHAGIFAAGAFVNGCSGALMNVPINLNAARVEHEVGRAILPHFHAAFSIGAAAGALVGAAFAARHVPVGVQLVVMAAAIGVARLALVRPATALDIAHHARQAAHAATSEHEHPPRGRALRSALGAWRERRTLLIGVVLLAASLSEGSAGNWLALAVVNGLESTEAVGALAYGTFVASMTVFRLAGTRLIDRLGRVTVLRASGGAALVGLLLFGLAPSLPLAWVGIVLWGCGAALANPIAIAAASDNPLRAAGRVSVVTSFSSVAQLSAPPVLGLLADAVGERQALLAICLATLVSLSVAGQVRPLPAPALHPAAPGTPRAARA